MEKQINSKVEDLRNDAANQEELMKSLAQIDEEGQLSDDVLDAVSGGAPGGLSSCPLATCPCWVCGCRHSPTRPFPFRGPNEMVLSFQRVCLLGDNAYTECTLENLNIHTLLQPFSIWLRFSAPVPLLSPEPLCSAFRTPPVTLNTLTNLLSLTRRLSIPPGRAVYPKSGFVSPATAPKTAAVTGPAKD